MSNTADDDQKFAAKLEEFFRIAEVNDACPFCKNTIWWPASGLKITHFIPMGQDIARGVSAYTLLCSQCGFLRLHSTLIVDGVAGKFASRVPQNKTENE